ncbi:hypothetical protein SUDANB1_05635 [Streptomyces sp. enrichment culture]|uniref:hypothetical protein n=1 Tax=Streptomyces sp. enrichment culture TaxID=1795815 RepID=UPI003F56F377
MATIRIRNTEDAVAVIAAMATKVIAAGGHAGHDLETVGRIMTSDDVLGLIRTAYVRHTTKGRKTPKAAVIAVGQAVVASYCDRAGIPTSN